MNERDDNKFLHTEIHTRFAGTPTGVYEEASPSHRARPVPPSLHLTMEMESGSQKVKTTRNIIQTKT